MGNKWAKKNKQNQGQQKGNNDSQNSATQEKESKEVGDTQYIDYSKPGIGTQEFDNN